MTPRANGRPAAAARGTLATLSAMVTVLLIYIACPAQAATARDSKFQPNLEATVRYLQDVQHEDGGFAEAGGAPDPDFSAWVALALAAAGINPREQTTARQHYAAGHSTYTYLVEHAHEASLTTDLERELLVVDATGTSPYDFGGVDLPSEILGRQITQGSEAGGFPHQAGSSEPGINDTIFAILALSPIHEQAVQEAVARASEWLERQQNCDGSWNTLDPREVRPCGGKRRLLAGEAEGEVDMTGAAIEALNAAGRTDREGQAKAFEFLHEEQVPNGGFSEFSGVHEPNVASTAWVVQAMWSAGVNPETWVTRSGLASEEPLSYLASMQQEDGHIRWEASRELNGMWMTAYVTPAFTGNPLPVPEVPYEELPALPPEDPAGAGDGGVATNPGNGVIAGGGGNGARLFSRPQPGSKGHTPGGARQRKSRKHDRPRTHKLNPGPARKTPAPTATTASVHHAKKHNQPTHRGTGGVTLTGTGAGDGAQTRGGEVKGILIGAPADALEPGAPGLHGVGAGDNQTSWLAIGIGGAAVLLALVGSLLERRRPRVVL
jgi:prenyltransferase beta subunit